MWGKTGTCWRRKRRTVRCSGQQPDPDKHRSLKIKNMKVEGFKVAEIPITYYKNTSLEKAIEYLFVEGGQSDPRRCQYPDPDRPRCGRISCGDPVVAGCIRPAAAFGAHEEENFRGDDPGERRAKGSTSLRNAAGLRRLCDQPVSAHESIRQLIESRLLHKDYYAAVDDYNSAVIHGIVKIASKMVSPRSSPIRGRRSSRRSGLRKSLSTGTLQIR